MGFWCGQDGDGRVSLSDIQRWFRLQVGILLTEADLAVMFDPKGHAGSTMFGPKVWHARVPSPPLPQFMLPLSAY